MYQLLDVYLTDFDRLYTHQRRLEVCCCIAMALEAIVMHLMEPPTAPRDPILGDGDLAVSPLMSIHAGQGTSGYAFKWDLSDENQGFDDYGSIRSAQVGLS